MTLLKKLCEVSRLGILQRSCVSSQHQFTRHITGTENSVIQNPTSDTDFLINKLWKENEPDPNDAYLVKTLGKPLPRPKPFPYEKKWYGVWAKLADHTLWRFDRNSKVILVEGNIASGKTEVAKRIAHDFDMKYFPSPTPEDFFILENGFDLRDLNFMLPRRIRHYDFEAFYSDPDPSKGMPGILQFHMLKWRILRYADAMLHLMSTGQGVVMERSPQGDLVFPHVLEQLGYLSAAGLAYYWDYYRRVLIEFMPPHLTVYIDSPVSNCRANITKRKWPHEVNSKVLTDEFLHAYEHFAKDVFIPDISRVGELLMVDANDGLDLAGIVEEVGNTDLATVDHDLFSKFQMWTNTSEEEMMYFRHIAQDRARQHRLTFIGPMHDAPELTFDTDEAIQYKEIVEEHPQIQYKKGYEPDHHSTWDILFGRM